MNVKSEELIFVDRAGAIRRFSTSKERKEDELMAVVLAVVFLPGAKQVVLFNRGTGASDMHDHWALTAGKMNTSDIADPLEGLIGKKITADMARRSAIREFQEELRITPGLFELEPVMNFSMPEKGIFFSMMAWPMREDQFESIAPDGAEVDKIRRFSLEEFDRNGHLGDAIMYKKAELLSFLEEKFTGA